MKETKEQLQKRINELELANRQWGEEDEKCRTEFAKAFGWGDKNFNSFSEPKWSWKTPSWLQIFVEIGRLLENNDSRKIKLELERAVNELFAAREELRKKDKS